MRSTVLLVALIAIAATLNSHRIHAQQLPATPDSVVLERTPCFYGGCPVYRLSLRRTGEVHFRSRNNGERLDTADHVAPATLDSLFRRAFQDGFFALPDSISGWPLCAIVMTEQPSLTLTFYGPSSKRVVYYTGCLLDLVVDDQHIYTRARSLEALMQLATAVDVATDARRWIHKNPRPR
jgi:hypothetical protein